MTQSKKPSPSPKPARRPGPGADGGAPAGAAAPPADAAPVVGLALSSEALARGILSAVLDPTIAIDGWGRVLIASDSVEAVLGWPPGELVGRNINVLMPEPHHSLHDEYLANYRRTGATNILGRTREFQVLHRDGHLLACEISISRVDLPEGDSPVFVGSFRDVSARLRAERALEESERRFRAIFERSFQYVGLLSPDGTVLEANQASLQGAGIRREDVIGRPFWETRWWAVSDAAREQLRAAIRAAAAGEFVRFETEHLGGDGEILSIDFSLKPVFDEAGEVVLLIPEGRDISDLKRAQRAETAMLRALATIGESAAMLAHEIKNPITAVNTALRAVAHQLGEDHQAVLEDLVGRMQRLERIMRRTLSFSRPIELRPGPVEAREIFEQTVRHLRPEIVKLGADVSLDVPPEGIPFEGDRQLLEEVLTNLLKNSLEVVRSGGRVRMRAGRRADGGVRLAVEDDGPGVAESMTATLFKPFATSKRKGTGLGLAFCKKVVEEHGGAIQADRGELGGARFTLDLPAGPARGKT